MGKRARHSHCCRPELREPPRRLRSREGRDQHPQMRPGELGLTQDRAAHPERWGSGPENEGKTRKTRNVPQSDCSLENLCSAKLTSFKFKYWFSVAFLPPHVNEDLSKRGQLCDGRNNLKKLVSAHLCYNE